MDACIGNVFAEKERGKENKRAKHKQMQKAGPEHRSTD